MFVGQVVLADLKNTLNMIRKNIVREDQATLLEHVLQLLQ